MSDPIKHEDRCRFWSDGEFCDCGATEIQSLERERDQWKSRADGHEQNFEEMLKRVDVVAAERDQWRECAAKLYAVVKHQHHKDEHIKLAANHLMKQFEKLKNP